MRKALVALAVIVLVASAAWAVGTVSTVNVPDGPGFTKYTITWLSDASGNATASIAVRRGTVVQCEFDPDAGGLAPDADYDIVLNDAHGGDVLSGNGANLSTSATKIVGIAVPLRVDQGNLSLSVSAAGNANSGVMIIWMGP